VTIPFYYIPTLGAPFPWGASDSQQPRLYDAVYAPQSLAPLAPYLPCILSVPPARGQSL